MVPATDYEVDDNWHTTGLAGTGSKTIEIDGEAFVPSHRYLSFADALGGKGRRASTRAELAQALNDAYDDTAHWQLIEAMIPRGEYSRTLSRFVSAARQKSVLGRQS